MKRRGIIVVIAIALVLIVLCILFLTGVIKIDFKQKQETNGSKKPICYIKYMDSYMLISSDDVVVASSEEAPSGIAEIAGITCKNIVVGEKIEPNEKKEFKYALKIASNFRKNSMDLDKIYISSDKTASAYINKVKILFGQDVDTEEKIRNLRDFYVDLKDLDGTLDMTTLSENNAGYTFKKN